jgi:hypothetical protein
VLKITITETQAESRWILQGRLVGPWVRELRSCWKKKHRAQTSQRCVVDLNHVTFIDESGERLLRTMSKKGAELVADGIYTKHVIEKVKVTAKGSLSKLVICLLAAVLVTAGIPADCVQAGPTLAKTVGMHTKNLFGKVTGKGSLSKLLICFFAAVVVIAGCLGRDVIRTGTKGGFHGDLLVCSSVGDPGVSVLHRTGRCYRHEASWASSPS